MSAGSELALQPNFVEFEVVVGNASYREGEHFYLTAEQARRAYSAPAQLAALKPACPTPRHAILLSSNFPTRA